MKVLFKSVWFGPSDVSREGKINQASGRRYRPGVHFVPAELKDALPKTAQIVETDSPVIEDDSPAPVVSRDPELTLRDFDEARAADEAAAKAAEEAELRANAEKLQRELEAEKLQRELEAEKPSKKKPGRE